MKAQSCRMTAIPWLTCMVACLALTASFGGIFIEGLYRDNVTIKTGWYANDLVTIPMAVLLMISFLMQERGDERGLLVWMGLMFYMFYNYAFYLFGAKFNEFFLVYVALFSLSLYSIIVGMLSIKVDALHEKLAYSKSKIVISAYLFFLAVPIAIVEIKQCLSFILSGRNPEVPTLIFALDLSIVIPTTILASILLLNNHPWGNVLAMMVLIKAFCYGLVLVTATLFINATGTGPYDSLLPFYISLVIGSFIFGMVHFNDLKPADPTLTKYYD